MPDSAKRAKPSVVSQLFDLAASRDLDLILRKALNMVVQVFGAESGSILFLGQPSRRLRTGAFRHEALARIEHLEEFVSRRLQDTVWIISDTVALPVSVMSLQNNSSTLVNIPLISDTRVIGTLSFVLPSDREVSDHQRHFLAQVARGVGQLISLVADLALAQRRLNQMSVFYQVGQALVTTFDVHKMLSDAMQLAANVIDAGAASLMLIDEEREELVFEVSHGSRGPMLRQQRIPLDEGIAGWVARNGRPIIANEARSDPRFSHRVDVRTGFLTQSIAAVPMKMKGQVIGILEVLNKYSGTGFDEEDIRLMTSIAAQAAIALENARLYQQVRHERDLVIRGQEEVRHELARSLHDGPVQLLAAISMSLDHLERLTRFKPEAVCNEIEALRKLVHQATRDTRNLLFELRPIILETQGMVPAFERYVEQLRASEIFVIHFNAAEQANYDTGIAGTIFSIVQEAVNNVKRHANARNVWLSLESKHDRFVVTVRDDGFGFDIGKVDIDYDKRTSFGVLNMRERAELIDAELHIESRTEPPDRGTVVRLILPLPPQPSKTKSQPLPLPKS